MGVINVSIIFKAIGMGLGVSINREKKWSKAWAPGHSHMGRSELIFLVQKSKSDAYIFLDSAGIDLTKYCPCHCCKRKEEGRIGTGRVNKVACAHLLSRNIMNISKL